MSFLPQFFQAVAAVATQIGPGIAKALAAAGVPARTAAALAKGAMTIGATAIQGAAMFGLNALLTPATGNGGDPIDYKANPTLPIPILFGRTASGGYQVHLSTTDDADHRYLHHFIVHSGGGPVDSFVKFYADSVEVTFDGSEEAIGSPFVEYMYLQNNVGSQSSSWLSPPSGSMGLADVPEWTTSHVLSGFACSRWALKWKADRYAFGPPKPLWVIQGVALYDPRQDSGVSGGSGSQDNGDQSTWVYDDNPACGAISWCLGYRHNDILTIGLGAPIDAIDHESFQEAAEVCDDNGWTFGCILTTADSKWDNLSVIAQAGAMQIIRSGAKISCIVQTPRVSLYTLTGADLVGEISVAGTVRRRDRVNTVNYEWRDESLDWAMKTTGPIEVSAFVTEDGETRSKGISYFAVQNETQGAQLAAYAIYDSRERAPITFTVKPYYQGLKPGDVITLNEPEVGLSSQDLLILARERDPSTGLVTLTARTETTAKHAAALAMTPP